MTNNSTHNTKLDNFIRDSLKDIEVPFNEAHWADMERRIDAVPKTNPFLKKSFTFNTIVGTAIVSAGLIIAYYSFDGAESSTEEQANAIVAEPENQQNNDVISAVDEEPTKNAADEIVNPIVTEEKKLPVAFAPIPVAPEEKKIVVNEEVIETKNEPAVLPVKIKQTKKEEVSTLSSASTENADDHRGTNFIKVFDSLRNTRVPTFGDQIDPVHGFVKNTQEEDRLQKEAQKKVATGVSDMLVDQVKSDTSLRNIIFSDTPSSTNPKEEDKDTIKVE